MKKMIILPRVGQMKPNVSIPVVKGLKGRQGGISPKAVLAAGGVARGGVMGVVEKKIPIPVIGKKEEPKGMTETEWRLADYLEVAEKVVTPTEAEKSGEDVSVEREEGAAALMPEETRAEAEMDLRTVPSTVNEIPRKQRRGRKLKAEMHDA